MTEWGVVGVIAALIGLGAGIVTPIIKLNTSIVKLTTIVDRLGVDASEMTDKNTKAHERLWDKNDEQDKRLNEHDLEIKMLQGKEK